METIYLVCVKQIQTGKMRAAYADKFKERALNDVIKSNAKLRNDGDKDYIFLMRKIEYWDI